jgi:hypothetical protein
MSAATSMRLILYLICSTCHQKMPDIVIQAGGTRQKQGKDQEKEEDVIRSFLRYKCGLEQMCVRSFYA